MANKHTKEELQELQALPLKVKIMKTKLRIREWVNQYGLNGIYVSFSGGKDSLALLHIAREIYPDIKAMHVNTTLEYPEIEKFVKTFDNVDIVKPELTFVEVIKKYGYPLISKEVAECVWGARKYLTQVIQQNSIAQTDRQKWHSQKYRQLCGLEEYAKFNSRDRQVWQAVQQAEQSGIHGGGEVRLFSKLTGILTAQNSINARLYNNYRQFASPTLDGDKQDGRESDNGEYP